MTPLLRPLLTAALVILGVLASPPSRADGFDFTGTSFCESVWTDGADQVVYGCSEALWLVRRGEKSAVILGQLGQDTVQIAGRGRGKGIALAVAGEKLTVGRYAGGKWESAAAPLPPAAKLTAAAIDAAGRAWFASESHGLVRWDARGLSRVPYPATLKAKILDLAPGPGGALVMSGERGTLLSFDGKNIFRKLRFGGQPNSGTLHSVWYGKHSQLLYASSRQKVLYQLDLRRRRADRYRLDVTWTNKMTGVSTPRGDVVVIDTVDGLVGFHKGTYYPIPGSDFSFTRQLSINLSHRSVLVASQDGIIHRPLPGLFPPPGQAITLGRKDQEKESSGGATGFAFTTWYLFSGSLLMGPAVFPSQGGAETDVSYTLDLELGLRSLFGAIFGNPVTLWPVLGYSYDTGDGAGGHRLVAGLGLSSYYLDTMLGVGLMSRFVMGSVGPDSFAVGVRNGLRLEAAIGMVILDVSHQMMYPDGGRTHEIRATLGLDFLQIRRFFKILSFLVWL